MDRRREGKTRRDEKVCTAYLLLLSPLLCFAGSVKLVNNTAYRLRAVIRGNDGTFLGDLTLNSQQTTTWTDEYGMGGRNYLGGNYIGQFYRSQTPYTISWYCMDGGDYALCDGIPTGGTVAALSCNGARICKPSKNIPVRDPYHRRATQQVLLQARDRSSFLPQRPPLTPRRPLVDEVDRRVVD